MMNFNVGDMVIALNNPYNHLSQHRVKGNPYRVNAVMYCSRCGTQKINIGEASGTATLECDCGNVQGDNGFMWTNSNLFMPAQEIEKALAMAVENEDYEMAAILRDVK